MWPKASAAKAESPLQIGRDRICAPHALPVEEVRRHLRLFVQGVVLHKSPRPGRIAFAPVVQCCKSALGFRCVVRLLPSGDWKVEATFTTRTPTARRSSNYPRWEAAVTVVCGSVV